MNRTLLSHQESGTYLYPSCSHKESCSKTSAVSDSASHNNWEFHLRDYLGHESHGGKLSNVSSGFHALHNAGICTFGLNSLCKLYVWYHRNYLYPCCLQRFKVRHRISCTKGYEIRLFTADDLYDFILIWSHEHDIYAKGLVCKFTGLANFLLHILSGSSAAGNYSRSSSLRNCSCHFSI